MLHADNRLVKSIHASGRVNRASNREPGANRDARSGVRVVASVDERGGDGDRTRLSPPPRGSRNSPSTRRAGVALKVCLEAIGKPHVGRYPAVVDARVKARARGRPQAGTRRPVAEQRGGRHGTGRENGMSGTGWNRASRSTKKNAPGYQNGSPGAAHSFAKRAPAGRLTGRGDTSFSIERHMTRGIFSARPYFIIARILFSI
jgi:hypothetical protein